MVLTLGAAAFVLGAVVAYAAADFTFVSQWGSYGAGNGQFKFPNDVAMDASGGVYVTVRDDNDPVTGDRLEKFDSSGNWKWTQTGFNDPECMAARGGVLYVATGSQNCIRTLDTSSGAILSSSWTTGGPAVNYASGIGFDAAGNCYLGSYYTNRIIKYSSTGAYITDWANPGTAGIAIDAVGNVLAVDYNNDASIGLNKYTNTGTLLWHKGSYGTGAGQFSTPWGLAYDSLGNIYVTDSGNNRVEKFDGNGTFVSQYGTPEGASFSFPGSLEIDQANALLYVCDCNNNRIQKFQLLFGASVAQGTDAGRPAAKVFASASATSVVDEITFSAFGTARVDTMTVHGLDASSTLRSDVSSVGLFRDNGNGTYGPEDTRVSSAATFSADASGSAVTFKSINSTVVAGAPASFWVVYKTGSSPGDRHEVGSRVASGDVSVSGATVTSFSPIISANGGRTVGIDLVPPSTTATGAPPSWSRVATISLTATDTYSGVGTSRYKVNGSATTTYAGPVVVTSPEDTDTVQYWSVDVAGNVESTKSVSFRLDLSAPTTPTSVTHLTDSTSTVTLSWGGSTDARSGLHGYQILTDGVLTTQTVSTTCTVTGLTAGQTYSFVVQAVDNVGNIASSAPVTETVADPSEYLRMTITTPDNTQTANFGAMDPSTPTTMSAATTITVSGFTALSYTLYGQAADFTGSLGATMPASQLRYRVYGAASVPWTAFSTTQQTLATGAGAHGRWQRSYFLDYELTVPYNYDAESYSAPVLYTLVEN
jgi:hypothetical protein